MNLPELQFVQLRLSTTGYGCFSFMENYVNVLGESVGENYSSVAIR